jgi:hypothetical protein
MFSGENISDEDDVKRVASMAMIMQEIDKIVFSCDEELGTTSVTIPKELWEQKFQNISE